MKIEETHEGPIESLTRISLWHSHLHPISLSQDLEVQGNGNRMIAGISNQMMIIVGSSAVLTRLEGLAYMKLRWAMVMVEAAGT